MKITTKQSGTQYNEITEDIINFHIDNNLTMCSVDRDLTFVNDEYVDDITQAEVDAGYKLVRKYYYSQSADPLYFKVQRGDATEAEWLAEVNRIKTAYPTPIIS